MLWNKKKDKKAKEEDPVLAAMSDKKKMTGETICPTCGKEVEAHKCRLCGAVKSINDVSGNVIWMRNGRLVEAFKDAREAYVKMAIRYSIPEDRWPKKFKGGKQ